MVDINDVLGAFGQGYEQTYAMANYPQLQQLNMLQQQAKLEQLQGLDPVSQAQIANNQSAIQAREQQQQLEMKKQHEAVALRTGKIAARLRDAGFEENEIIESLSDMDILTGGDGSVFTPENVNTLIDMYSASVEPKEKKYKSVAPGIALDESTGKYVTDKSVIEMAREPQIGRYKSVKTDSGFNLIDTATGKVSKSYSAGSLNKSGKYDAPPGLPPAEEKAFNALPAKEQLSIIKQNLSPEAIAKKQDRVKQLKTAGQVKKIGIDLIDKILNNPELDDVLGKIDGAYSLRLFAQNEVNAIADIEELQSILTSDVMDLMSGVLSESDMSLLRTIAAGGLNRRRDEKEFISRLKQVRATLSNAVITDAAVGDEVMPGVRRVR